MQVSRRSLFALIAGLGVLGRTKPSESKHVGVSEGPQGRKYFAVCDWGPGSDIAVTVVYWRDTNGDFYIQDMHECTAEQVEDRRCPCRRWFPEHAPDDAHFLASFKQAGGELDGSGTAKGAILLPVKV